MDILILNELVQYMKSAGFNTKLSVEEWMSIVSFINKREQALLQPPVKCCYCCGTNKIISDDGFCNVCGADIL